MLSLDQIKNVTFSKARGGYSTAEVDDFIDQCVDTVTGLIEERNTSNKKMEVLADKLVEYRNEEDSIRSALVNAQRLGDTIVREANQKAALTQEDATIKAEKILKDAQERAEAAVNSVADEVKAQEAELARLKQEVAMFKERLLSIYREHLSLIQILPEDDSAPAEEPEETPLAVEEPVMEQEPEREEPVAEEEVAIEQPVVEETPEEAEPVLVEEQSETVPLVALEEVSQEPQETQEEEATKSRFADLKFGEDYVIGQDDEGKSRGFFKRKK